MPSQNIGLVCDPGTSGNSVRGNSCASDQCNLVLYSEAEITRLTITAVSHNSITVQWNVSYIIYE